MSRVMLLIPSASYRAPDFMQAAKALGVEVTVGSDRSSPLQDLHPEGQVGLDYNDPERGAAQIRDFGRTQPLEAIVAVDDAGARLAARASWMMELPHNPPQAVEATRNKALLREELAQQRLPSPTYQIVDLGASPELVGQNLAYPVVLKPLSLSASRGVIRADTAKEFSTAFNRVKAILGQPECIAEAGELTDRILVESYIPGVEVSLEGLLSDGSLRVLAIFDKPDPLEGPFFEETIYVTPSRLEASVQGEVAEATVLATRALGLRDGPVHAELRINSEGIYPIDIAARSIGGLCSRTLSFGTGMSLEEIILRHATGRSVPSYERESKAAGVMMIPIAKKGHLRAVFGKEAAEAGSLIESVNITMHIGAEVVPLPEGSEYLGFIFASGDEPAAVEAALREAHACLTLEID